MIPFSRCRQYRPRNGDLHHPRPFRTNHSPDRYPARSGVGDVGWFMFHQDQGCGEHTSYSTAPNRVAYTSDHRLERAVAGLMVARRATINPAKGGTRMSDSPSPRQSNTLGNASLVLSILSLALVFGVGLCALTGIT